MGRKQELEAKFMNEVQDLDPWWNPAIENQQLTELTASDNNAVFLSFV